MRINKYVAKCGIASRREADALIAAGRVLVNGTPATLGQIVDDEDRVTVKGASTEKRYVLFYKPRGVLTHGGNSREPDVASFLRAQYGITGAFPVGRLDKASEGLLLVTNDGRVTGALLDPAHGHEREYEVWVDKRVTDSMLRKLSAGVYIEGYKTKPARAIRTGTNCFRITLTEGKKHQIRRMCAAAGYQVRQLTRIRIAHLTRDGLAPGQYREIRGAELHRLLGELGVARGQTESAPPYNGASGLRSGKKRSR